MRFLDHSPKQEAKNTAGNLKTKTKTDTKTKSKTKKKEQKSGGKIKKTKISVVIMIVNFVLLTEFSEIMWSFPKDLCAHVLARAMD